MATNYDREQNLNAIKAYVKDNRAKISIIYNKLSSNVQQTWIKISTQNIASLEDNEIKYITNEIIPLIDNILNNSEQSNQKDTQKLISSINNFLIENQNDLLNIINKLSEQERDIINQFIKNKESINYETLTNIIENIIPKIQQEIDKKIYNKNKKEKYLDKVINFTIEYSVELEKITVNNLGSREKSFLIILREDRIYEITEKQAAFIYHNLIPILKKEYEEHHTKSANYLNIIENQINKIRNIPEYNYIVSKLGPQDQQLFYKCINDKYSLNQTQLKTIISHTIPLLRQKIKNQTERDKMIIEIRTISKENNRLIINNLNEKEIQLYKNTLSRDEVKILNSEIEYIFKKIKNIINKQNEAQKETRLFLTEQTNILRKTLYEDEILKVYSKETISKASYELETEEQALLIKRYQNGYPITDNEKYIINTKVLPKLKYYCAKIEPDAIYENKKLSSIIGITEEELKKLVDQLTKSEKDIYLTYIEKGYKNLSKSEKNNLINIIIPRLKQLKEINKDRLKKARIRGISIITRFENIGISKEYTLKAIEMLNEREIILLRKTFGNDYLNIMDTKKLTVAERTELNNKILPKIKKNVLELSGKKEKVNKKRERKKFIQYFTGEYNPLIVKIAIKSLNEKNQQEIIEFDTKETITYNERNHITQCVYNRTNKLCQKIVSQIAKINDEKVIKLNNIINNNLNEELSEEEITYIANILCVEEKQSIYNFIAENNSIIDLAIESLSTRDKKLIKKYNNQVKISKQNKEKIINEIVPKLNKKIKDLKQTITLFFESYDGEYENIINAYKNIINSKTNEEVLISEQELETVYNIIQNGKQKTGHRKSIYDINLLNKYSKEAINKAIEHSKYQEILKKVLNEEKLSPNEQELYKTTILKEIKRYCISYEEQKKSENKTVKQLLNISDSNLEVIKQKLTENELTILNMSYNIEIKNLIPNQKKYIIEELIPYIKEIEASLQPKRKKYELEKTTIYDYFLKMGYTEEQINDSFSILNKSQENILKRICGADLNEIIDIDNRTYYEKNTLCEKIIPLLKDKMDGKIITQTERKKVYKTKPRNIISTIKEKYNIIIYKIALTKLTPSDCELLHKYENYELMTAKEVARVKNTISKVLEIACSQINEKINHETIDTIKEEDYAAIANELTTIHYQYGSYNALNKNIYTVTKLLPFKKETVDEVLQELSGKEKELYSKIYLEYKEVTPEEMKFFQITGINRIAIACRKRESVTLLNSNQTISEIMSEKKVKSKNIDPQVYNMYKKYKDIKKGNLTEEEIYQLNKTLSIIFKAPKKESQTSFTNLFIVQERHGYSREITIEALKYIKPDHIELLKKQFGDDYESGTKVSSLTSEERYYLSSVLLNRLRNVSKKIKDGIDPKTINRLFNKNFNRDKTVRELLAEYPDIIYQMEYAISTEKVKDLIQKYDSKDKLVGNESQLTAQIIRRLDKKCQKLLNKISSLESNDNKDINLISKKIRGDSSTPEEENYLETLTESQLIKIYNEIISIKPNNNTIYRHKKFKRFTKETVDIALNNVKDKTKGILDENNVIIKKEKIKSLIMPLEIECLKIEPYNYDKTTVIFDLISLSRYKIYKAIEKLNQEKYDFYNYVISKKWLINLTKEEQKRVLEELIPAIYEANEKERKNHRNEQTIIELLQKQGFEEANIRKSIHYLSHEDQCLIFKRYGTDLNQLNRLSIKEKRKITSTIKKRLIIINELLKQNMLPEEIRTKLAIKVYKTEAIEEDLKIKIMEYIQKININDLVETIITSNINSEKIDEYFQIITRNIDNNLINELTNYFTKKEILIFMLCTNNTNITMSLSEINEMFNISTQEIKEILTKIITKLRQEIMDKPITLSLK